MAWILAYTDYLLEEFRLASQFPARTHEAEMTRTLILFFHPDPARSKANAALLAAARPLPGVEVADMARLHQEGVFDTDAEVRRLHRADRLVLQFPVQWYSTPPLLKAWQDTVLSRMFYARPEEGEKLRGLPVLVAATAGNVPEAYGPTGVNLYPLEALLRPLEATAHRCGMAWARPHLLFRANRLSAAELEAAGEAYAAQLQCWTASTAQAVAARARLLPIPAEA
jgi:putative NADPH-quinone reductase